MNRYLVSTRVRRRLILAVIAGLAFGCGSLDVTVSRPRELAGRWARLRADSVWTDTLILGANGRVTDPLEVSSADSSHWSVVRSRFGEGLCIGRGNHMRCQPYRLEGDTLVWGRPANPMLLRRAR